MGYRIPLIGLAVPAALLLLAACQGTSKLVPGPTAAADPIATLAISSAEAVVPASTNAIVPTPTVPAPTPQPAAPSPANNPPTSVTRPTQGQPQTPSSTLGLTVETGAGTETVQSTLNRSAVQPGPTHESQEALPEDAQGTASNDPLGGAAESAGAPSSVRWSFNGTAWSPIGPPPACAEPFAIQTPVDMSQVTAALWPGQSRGGYKGHGGFRFAESDAENVTVRAPLGSHLVQASKYLEGAEEQILLFFSVPCGFFYRFDHVRGLSAKITDALTFIPPATSSDSRTTYVSPPVWVEAGEVIGTSVGIPPSNIFVDFGLYDVRKPNGVTPDPAWADSFASDKEFGHYGVCFFDYLPGADGAAMRALPTGKEGPTSDYCQ